MLLLPSLRKKINKKENILGLFCQALVIVEKSNKLLFLNSLTGGLCFLLVEGAGGVVTDACHALPVLHVRGLAAPFCRQIGASCLGFCNI